MQGVEDERPIPLGPAAVDVEREPGAAAVGSRWALTHDCPGPVEPSPRAAGGNRTPVGDGCRAPAAPPHIETTRAGVEPSAAQPVAGESPVLGQPTEHPLAALPNFRMEVVLAEPAPATRRRAPTRFLAAYLLVLAVVAGLVAAFLAIATRVGSGHP